MEFDKFKNIEKETESTDKYEPTIMNEFRCMDCPHEWSLRGKVVKSKPEQVTCKLCEAGKSKRECYKCKAVFRPYGEVCPACGYKFKEVNKDDAKSNAVTRPE